ncbi:MAG: hypothetical protein AAFS07_16340 [Pseudomonadota bacterium]
MSKASENGRQHDQDPEASDVDEALFMLIPWHVNGTLSPEEDARILAEAEACPRFAAEIRHQRRLATALIEMEPAQNAAGASWQRLEAMVRAEQEGVSMQPAAPARRRRARTSWLPRWLEDMRRETLWLGGGLGLALPVMAALLLGGAFDRDPVVNPTEFITMTTPDGGSAGEAGAEGPRLRLRAPAEMPEDAVAALVTRHGLRVLDGPSTGGIYTLSAAGEVTEQEAIAVLERAVPVLAAVPGVVVVPVGSGPE